MLSLFNLSSYLPSVADSIFHTQYTSPLNYGDGILSGGPGEQQQASLPSTFLSQVMDPSWNKANLQGQKSSGELTEEKSLLKIEIEPERMEQNRVDLALPSFDNVVHQNLPSAKFPISTKIDKSSSKKSKRSKDFVKDIIQEMGLHFEEHHVTTEDGYILTLFRVNDPTVKRWFRSKPPIFVQHGIFCDAGYFIFHKKRSLVYRLAQEGYDVWLGNNRGNKFSRAHEKLDVKKDEKKFFDYSFYEFGKYDQPAMIDYVLAETGYSQVSYIGHSQGTTQMFSALSENHGQMDRKIKLFVALAPIANLQQTPIPGIKQASKDWTTLLKVTNWLGIYEVSNVGENDELRKKACYLTKSICDSVNKVLDNWAKKEDQYSDPAAQAILYKHERESASVKSLIHFSQMAKYGFQQFDYGDSSDNEHRYGQRQPPTIEIEKISERIPIAIFKGTKDDLSDLRDVRWLQKKLGKRLIKYKLINEFDHSGFAVGKKMDWIDDALKLIRSYN